MILGCKETPYIQGQRIYEANCGNCHMPDGTGLKLLIPALSKENLKLEDPSHLVCLIRNGLPFNPESRQEMPANKEMTQTELANLINFLGHTFYGNTQTVRVNDLPGMESSCQTR